MYNFWKWLLSSLAGNQFWYDAWYENKNCCNTIDILGNNLNITWILLMCGTGGSSRWIQKAVTFEAEYIEIYIKLIFQSFVGYLCLILGFEPHPSTCGIATFCPVSDNSATLQ